MKNSRIQLVRITVLVTVVLCACPAHFAAAQSHASEFPAPQGAPPDSHSGSASDKPAAPVASHGTMGAARAIPFDSITPTATANGGERRAMIHGTLATGETVELHQSMQTPGTPAPALHVIQHSELILVREGTLEFDHEVDGKVVAETAGPGGMFYVAFGTRHAIRNAGTTPARYFVVAIGGDAK